MEPNYGCIMLNVETTPAFEAIYDIVKQEDLSEDGVERTSHVTLLYGVHEGVTTEEIRRVFKGLSIEQINCNSLSLFEKIDQDVLKVDVEKTGGLMLVRFMLELNVPNTQTFPDYKPHLTIAYLKAGTGKHYVTGTRFSYPMRVTDIVYSYNDRKNRDKIYESVITDKKLL